AQPRLRLGQPAGRALGVGRRAARALGAGSAGEGTVDGLTEARVEELLAAAQSVRCLVVGDLMLDRYVVGSVDRISPEAPVPVVRVEHESSALGGAANVAHNV